MARYEVGPLVVDIDRFEALANGRLMSLKPKAFDALVYFCQHPDRVLSKQELLDAVWPGLVVTESSLFKVVQEIRRALDEVGCVTAQIENVPGRGYRLVLAAGAVLSTVAMAATHPTPSRTTPTARARLSGRNVIGVGGAVSVDAGYVVDVAGAITARADETFIGWRDALASRSTR